MEIKLSFPWIPVEISMEIHWKSSLNFNENQVEISMEYQWKSNGNPLWIQLEFNSNFNGIPVGSIVNWVEISMKYQLIGNPVEILMKCQ